MSSLNFGPQWIRDLSATATPIEEPPFFYSRKKLYDLFILPSKFPDDFEKSEIALDQPHLPISLTPMSDELKNWLQTSINSEKKPIKGRPPVAHKSSTSWRTERSDRPERSDRSDRHDRGDERKRPSWKPKDRDERHEETHDDEFHNGNPDSLWDSPDAAIITGSFDASGMFVLSDIATPPTEKERERELERERERERAKELEKEREKERERLWAIEREREMEWEREMEKLKREKDTTKQKPMEKGHEQALMLDSQYQSRLEKRAFEQKPVDLQSLWVTGNSAQNNIQQKNLQQQQNAQQQQNLQQQQQNLQQQQQNLQQQQNAQQQQGMQYGSYIDNTIGVQSIQPNMPPSLTRWFYVDPSGTQQGPFSSADMLEWFKSGFFSYDLPIRTSDGPEYIQLGQLISTIGRIPFIEPVMTQYPYFQQDYSQHQGYQQTTISPSQLFNMPNDQWNGTHHEQPAQEIKSKKKTQETTPQSHYEETQAWGYGNQSQKRSSLLEEKPEPQEKTWGNSSNQGKKEDRPIYRIKEIQEMEKKQKQEKKPEESVQPQQPHQSQQPQPQTNQNAQKSPTIDNKTAPGWHINSQSAKSFAEIQKEEKREVLTKKKDIPVSSPKMPESPKPAWSDPKAPTSKKGSEQDFPSLPIANKEIKKTESRSQEWLRKQLENVQDTKNLLGRAMASNDCREICQMFVDSVGSESKQLAEEFIHKRSSEIQLTGAFDPSFWVPTPIPSQAPKKKGKKGQKVDPAMLGFS